MNRLPLAILRRLRRALAYSVLDALVTKDVLVLSAETALDDVLRVVRDLVPIRTTTMEPDLHYRAGAIAKYGILDVTYGIESTSLPIHRPGLVALRTLGLVDAGEMGQDFLHDVAAESEAGSLYLKVFLQAEGVLPTHESLRRLREGMPLGFWPHRFVVKDACLTNVHSIWLAKHLYL